MRGTVCLNKERRDGDVRESAGSRGEKKEHCASVLMFILRMMQCVPELQRLLD